VFKSSEVSEPAYRSTSAERRAVDPASSQAKLEAIDPFASIVELDFKAKTHRRLTLDELQATIEPASDGPYRALVTEPGRFVWIDIDVTDVEEARRIVCGLALCAPELVEDALTREPATQLGRYDDYIHLVLSGCRLVGHKFELERVDAIMGERFLLTLHRGQPVFLEAVRKSYIADFIRFAQSPSFLLYELYDHLIDNYLAVHKKFEERVEQVQTRLIGDVDEGVFAEASELGSDLLHLRKVVLPARAVLTDLSTRKSPFVSEATQPFLGNMVGTVERVLQDVLVDRDILSGSLNNYMSMVAHKTNRVMSKLTVVSIIFLPLTFLCGVYGMNFDVLPELHWENGYGFFWLAVLVIVAGLIYLMRRNKLL
jgi:magnesium transporter